MNFRMSLAVAAAATLSFACADKQATIPELEEAMIAPPGMRVVGLYKMTVTPTETSDGVQWAFQSIPVGKDGNPLTNPPNTIQVKGAFGQVTTTGPGGCSGKAALTAAVELKNFTVDPLTNVWVQITSMSGRVGNVACNSSNVLASPNPFTSADMITGVWRYNDLAAAPDATGLNVGGTSLPISAGGVWGLEYVTATPFTFFFKVIADEQAPVVANSSPNGLGRPLSWTSAVAPTTRLQICAAATIADYGTCPVALSVDQAVAGTGVGPWSYSFEPTGLVPKQVYQVRAANVYAAGQSIFWSQWAPFTYSDGALPLVTNVTWAANAPTGVGFVPELTWTTAEAFTDTWLVLCLKPCPAVRPGVPDPAILFDGWVPWDMLPLGDGLSHYVFDATAFIRTDINTGTYLDPAVIYDWRVYDYDGFTIPGPAYASPHSTGTITITPVQLAPTITNPGTAIAPVIYSMSLDATFPVAWTTDATVSATVYEIYDLADPLVPLPNAPAIPGVASGGGFTYGDDIKLAMGGGLYEGGQFRMVVYNADLFGVFGSEHFFNVIP